MTSRTYPQYSPAQILQRCSCITLDDLLARVYDRNSFPVKTIVGAIEIAEANNGTGLLLEWPDGALACLIYRGKRCFAEITDLIKIEAYKGASYNGGVIFLADEHV
jgi:hypothetical protein